MAAELARVLRERHYEVEEKDGKLTVNDCAIEFFPGPKYGVSGYVGSMGGAKILDTCDEVLEWLSGRPLRILKDKFDDEFVKYIEFIQAVSE